MLPELRDGRVTLRSLREEDAAALAAMVEAPSVREWWGTSTREVLVEGFMEDARDQVAFAIEIDGELAGWLGVPEENEPDYRHAAMDILLGAECQNAGHGRVALRLAARWLVDDRGHHRITIDPALANARAIRVYESIGFQRVGVMRSYERGPDGEWHDALLMDMLASELR
ncbi:MAG TPA: GNAT family protein [Solirubrobacteraceae bacterium]|nr:GNAT family protein [Solirubrobacteraceae bacterium]